jgi:predicted AAA+ superfamily ATPase
MLTHMQELLRKMARVRILVVGDVMLDRYLWGDADRLSPEAPVPVVKIARETCTAGGAANVLVYATSNRRHMLPEYFSENLETKHVGDEVHPGESTEEKISLSERFGLWVSFYPFDQDDYLRIVSHWLTELGCSPREIEAQHEEALQWAQREVTPATRL